MSEAKMQSELWQWFYNSYPQYRFEPSEYTKKPRTLLVHNYNNPRNKIQGAMLAGIGLVAGFPDLTLYVPSNGFPGMMLELKKTGEVPRPEQMEVLDKLRAMGYYATWSNDLEECKKLIKNYLGKK